MSTSIHSKALTNMEPASTGSAAGFALAKYFGTQLLLGAVATALAFIVLPPKTKTEFIGRMACTLLASYLFGPMLVSAFHTWFPGLFESAAAVAVLNGQDASFGVLYIAAPLQVVAGMPAWWIIGAFMRWFDKRRGADIADMWNDARSTLPSLRTPSSAAPAQREISPMPDADA